MRKEGSILRHCRLVSVSVLGVLGCAGARSVLGTPTVVSIPGVDLPPEVTNPDEVRAAMLEEYPPLLRDAGISGFAVLRLFVNETGQVQQASLEQSSRHQALDAVALTLATIIRFIPAHTGGEAVPVTVTIPLTPVPPPPRRAVRREIRRES